MPASAVDEVYSHRVMCVNPGACSARCRIHLLADVLRSHTRVFMCQALLRVEPRVPKLGLLAVH